MPTFTYVTRTREGKREKGTMVAENRGALTRMLQARGLTLDQVQEKGGGATDGRAPSARTAVKSKELVIFTRQLSTIVNAGLPLLQGLDILAEQTEDQRFAGVLRDIAQGVEGGETFSEALRKYPRIYSDLYVSMVRAGEASGDLDGVLAQLADYMESMEELKRRIRSAMAYPVGAFSLILIIAGGLIAFVVPTFKRLFEEMAPGEPLPGPTQILIDISGFVVSWKMAVVIVAVIATVIFTRVYGATPAGRYNLDALKLRLPVFGKLLRKVAISRFTRTLSTLTKSGVAILGALEIAERTSGNEVFAKAVREAGDSVRRGETLADPLARSGQFPSMVTRMIGVGEKTGALETMLTKVSEFYDSEVKAAVDALTSLIEPLLIMMMGIVVGGMLIALYMPLINMPALLNKTQQTTPGG
ncbi:MAG: type II secretion system F family protein [Candidatus Hydrogenedentes bacterium]|nr:type II secretion system F family protein [Candidatus Hydrogenedentota bacterium]